MQPNVPDDRVGSAEGLVQIAQELTDEEIAQAGEILFSLQRKWGTRPNTPENLESLRDEGLTRMADIGILASFDPTPCFYGEPPTFVIEGKITGHNDHKYGFDHERKMYEVRKATQLGEDYRGQKERYNTRKPKK